MKHARIAVEEPVATASAVAGRAATPFVRGDGAADPLLRAWQRLEAGAVLPTQCHLFAASLACTMLAGANWEFFTALGGPEGIGALLPLCRDPGFFARWRMIGAREIFEPGDCLSLTAQDAQGLAARLARESRPLRFDRVPADSPLIPALRSALKGRAWLSVRPAVPCPTITLGDGWDEPESRFNSGRRSDFRRAARRAEEMGDVTYEVLSPGEAGFDALFDEAIQVELQSWKREAGTAIAVDRPKEAFFREYFRRAAGAGQLRIAFLRIDGRAIAMQLALEWQQRFWLFKIGYDETYAKCSPGTLLMLHTIGWAARRGLSAYELLGGVEPWIAEFWTRETHPCVQLRSYPFGPRGMVALGSDTICALRKRLARARK